MYACMCVCMNVFSSVTIGCLSYVYVKLLCQQKSKHAGPGLSNIASVSRLLGTVSIVYCVTCTVSLVSVSLYFVPDVGIIVL